MAKILKYNAEAHGKILNGVNALEKAVTSTLGPHGRNVIIDEYGSIHSTKDGVTVAKAITLSDPFENLGANAIKEVAEKSNANCGDGTTTSTLLAATIYRNGLKYVNLGANATQIKNGIKKAADAVVKHIVNTSIKVSGKNDIKRVATVSANGDSNIGDMIADVMDKIGNDGTVKVENGNGLEMTSKVVEGMVIDQSYVSPYMVTNAETMEAELENPFVLIANKKLANIQELAQVFNEIGSTGRPVLIIADELQDDIISTLIINKMRGALNSVAIKSPSFGENRKAILEDIATICGGRVIADDTGTKIEHASLATGIIGMAKRVVINKENTVIFGGAGDQAAIDARANTLRSQIKTCTSEYDREKLQERLAKLTSGIGVISVGATTEAERKELRDRVDDAFSAAKAALRAGIVAGGGSALLNAYSHFDNWKDTNMLGELVGDETIGATILFDSLTAPAKKIIENAGIDASLIVNKILENTSINNVGYDVMSKTITDMISAGIIDPTEVVINEIQNATSIASLLLTTETLIVEEPKKDTCNCNGHSMPPMM